MVINTPVTVKIQNCHFITFLEPFSLLMYQKMPPIDAIKIHESANNVWRGRRTVNGTIVFIKSGTIYCTPDKKPTNRHIAKLISPIKM